MEGVAFMRGKSIYLCSHKMPPMSSSHHSGPYDRGVHGINEVLQISRFLNVSLYEDGHFKEMKKKTLKTNMVSVRRRALTIKHLKTTWPILFQGQGKSFQSLIIFQISSILLHI